MKKICLTLLLTAMALSAGAYDNFRAAFNAGSAARNKKDYKTALSCFTEAEKLAKSNGERCEASFYTGIALAESGKVDEGIAKIREALKICPNLGYAVTLQYHIGYYLQKDKRTAEAVEELKKARALDPEVSMADRSGIYAAQLLINSGKTEDAEKLLQSIVSDPATADGKINSLVMMLQLSYKMKKDSAPIIAQLENAGVQKGKTEVERCFRLWNHYLRTRQIDKAIAQAELLEKNTALNQGQRDLGTFYLARTYSYYKKDAVKAKEYWEKIQNSPNAYTAKQAKEHLAKMAKMAK